MIQVTEAPTYRCMLYCAGGRAMTFHNPSRAKDALDAGWQDTYEGLPGFRNRDWQENPPVVDDGNYDLSTKKGKK